MRPNQSLRQTEVVTVREEPNSLFWFAPAAVLFPDARQHTAERLLSDCVRNTAPGFGAKEFDGIEGEQEGLGKIF